MATKKAKSKVKTKAKAPRAQSKKAVTVPVAKPKTTRKRSKNPISAKKADELALFFDLFTKDDLTDNQAKVVAVKLLPESLDMTADQKCAMAGVSRRTWFRLELDEKVQAACERYAPRLFSLDLCSVAHRLNKMAKESLDPDEYKWAIELIMNYSQLGKERAKAGASSFNFNVTPEQLEAERKENLGKGLTQFGVAIKVTG